MGGRLSRREFLRAAGSVGAVAAAAPLLAACGREADRLSFLNWQDYIAPETIPRFERRTGVDVTYQTYASNDELEGLLIQAGRPRRGGREGTTFDLIVPSDNFVRRFLRRDILRELDRSLIGNLDNLQPELREAAFDPGNRYTVPWATGTTGIAYDPAAVPDPPGWEVFLDPSLSGRMTLLEEIRDAFAAALFSLGLDPNTSSGAEIDAAADRLVEMKAVIRGFDSETYVDGLSTGELAVAQAYSSDFQLARQRNPSLAFSLPPEGALRWVDSLAVPAGAPHEGVPERFIQYYLGPEVSAEVAQFARVDTGNAAAVDLLDPSLAGDPVVFPPPDVLAGLTFTADLGDQVETRYREAWERVLAA
jgi:putrescine transport system substrate-binding protein